ncbi:MAG TPA: phosphoribosylamine--glycine ligase [Candidatus Obscuribacterales bacterium]
MTLDRQIKVLVIGGGGREHALCWKITQSPFAERVYCAPGNGGTATTYGVTNVDLCLSDFPAIVEFSRQQAIDLIVVGPDNPLAEGIVDSLEDAGLRVFGPRREAARLEWSKSFAKHFMTRHGIPTARYAVTNSLDMARQALREDPGLRVVKVDGLALGKGVFVCDSEKEAVEALSIVLAEKRFGDAGKRVVIEERLQGEEISLLALCDGRRLVPLLPSRDHKRRFDKDCGPNTGGMGAYAPAELYEQCRQQVEQKVLQPIRKALASGELRYKGVLYIGLMITTAGSGNASSGKRRSLAGASAGTVFEPYVLEFNARFGDPETQAILPLLSSDLLPALWACTEGTLDKVALEWSGQAACCVVAAAGDYPEGSSRGEPIELADLPPHTVAFHAGTRLADGQIVTNGGRIIAVTGTGPSLELARDRAYEGIAKIGFKGMDYRRDIAERALRTCQSM